MLFSGKIFHFAPSGGAISGRERFSTTLHQELLLAVTRSESRILIITCFGHFVTHYNMLVFPALVLPLASQLGMELSQILNLSFWMYLLFGLTALPWGLAADRWGPRPLLVLFFLGSGLSSLAIVYFLDSPLPLSLALASLGLFSAIYHPAGLGLISKGMSRVSVAMGYNGMFGNLGLAAAPLLTGLLNWLWGIQAAYLAVTVFNLAGMGMMIFMNLPHGEAAALKDEKTPNAKSWLPFLVLLGAMMLGGMAYRGSTVIMPAVFELKVLTAYKSLTENLSANVVATALTSLVFLMGVAAQYLGGRVGERFDTKRAYLAFHAISVPAALLAGAAQGSTLGLLIVVYCFFLLGMQPIENTLVGELTPPGSRHAAFGAKFVLTFGVGALAVKLVGRVQEGWGIAAVIPSMGLISLCLVGMILILIQVTRSKRDALKK